MTDVLLVSSRDRERFARKVQMTAEDGCWTWAGARNARGYGIFKIAGRSVLAHRVALALHLGRDVVGCVLHSCDNAPCCNPAHLREGSRLDNARDAVERGRLRPARGERNAAARLSAADVRAIRERHASGRASYARLAAEYGVTPGNIGHIVTRRAWKELA
jgi:hypothetical protein